MDEIDETAANSKLQNFRERLSNPYRLIVMNDETFEEVRSFQLNLFNVYLLLSSIIVVVAILVVLLIAYTPIKNYLPGFDNHISQDDLYEVHQQVDVLQKELDAQILYTNDLKAHLFGDYEYVPDEDELNEQAEAEMANLAAQDIVTTSTEEEELRRELELERVGQAAQQEQGSPLPGSQNVALEQLYFVAPVGGEIRAGFNTNDKHLGVDIIGPKGTPVKAAADGYVILSDYTYNTGHTIGIQHSNNIITFYKHNSELLKEIGSFVRAGEAIAIIGNTGHQTTGPHLHFELWHKGIPVDPVDYIRF